jgi:hypothetical protein
MLLRNLAERIVTDEFAGQAVKTADLGLLLNASSIQLEHRKTVMHE